MKFAIDKLAIFIIAVILMPAAGAENGYYRWPSSYGDTLVFTAEGDLWRRDSDASQAVRLTTHDEVESQAHISPEGDRIAFVASFDGIEQVYLMPLQGGAPRQLTFEPVPVSVRGWSADGRILYTSRSMEGSSRVRELRLVDPDDLSIERIPLRYATTGTFDESGQTLFFTRHGVDTVGDSARLYRGGGTSQLWRFELGGDEEAVRLAEDFDGPIEEPMYWDGRIYFISDESGYDNIWSMNSNGRSLRQHSQFEGWQIQGATLRDGVIHFQRGADIFAWEIASETERLVEIDLTSDRDRSRLRWLEEPLDFLDGVFLGGEGDRVALTTRGHVTLAGTDERRRVSLNLPSQSRAREAIPGPDGEWVYLILDQEERGELWRFAADGSGSGEQLTTDASSHRWSFTLSPDGRWLIHHDKSASLWKLDLQSRENTLIMSNNASSDNVYGNLTFSPGGRYVAFPTEGERWTGAVIVVHDLQTGENIRVTNDRYRSYAPAFSSDGKWLYFLTERNFNPSPGSPWGDRNMGVQFDERTQIFALALADGERFPFVAPNELTAATTDDDTEEVSEQDDEAVADEPAESIDWLAASGRLYQVPVPAGNYARLTATEERLYLLEDAERANNLMSLPITHEDPELAVFAERVVDYQLSVDGSSLFFRTGGGSPTMAIVPAGVKAPDDLSDHRLRLQGWRLAIDPETEWQQMFLDGWRMHRDFAFDADMRGVDWAGVRDRLLPLTGRVRHRTDLADLFGQMAAEIGILHSQVNAGELPADEEGGSLASLGARYQSVPGGLEIVQIYRGEADRPDTLGPLDSPDVDVEPGDIIISLNNHSVADRGRLEQALMFQAGQQVLLETQRAGTTIRNVVTPVSTGAESMLRYLDWVGTNASKVSQQSDGQIGYLHLRAMGGGDVASFARDFFAQNHLDGMIIDVRDNSGGNVDSIIIGQLLRQAWAFWQRGPDSQPYLNMQDAFRGHLAVLVNAGTYSDGESFAAGVKALELAPIIGERTAGAGIWLSDRNRLADGGMSRVAENPQYGLDGRWLIEGTGIEPDIEVIAGPHALFNGDDQQLTAAVSYLQQKIIEEPIPALRPQPLPPMGERGRDIVD